VLVGYILKIKMIHFITPLYRYDNLEIIYSTIVHQIDDFKWHLIEGTNKLGDKSTEFMDEDNRVLRYKIKTNFIFGHEQRNYFIQNIECDKNDWCYFLDDDNVVTSDLCEVYNSITSDYDVIVFSQKKGLTDQQRLLGCQGSLKLGSCDIGSFLIRYEVLKKTLIPYIDQRNSDGHFCEQISNIPNIKILYKPEKFVRYNSLSLIIN
jgi:hypothetical protein